MKDAEYYVGVYCDCLEAELHNRDIALESYHMLGKMSDFRGDLPSSSGFHFDTISPRADRFKEVDAEFEKAKNLLNKLPLRQKWVVVACELLLGKPDENYKALSSIEAVASHLGEKPAAFKEERLDAIDKINAQLGILVA